MPKDLLSKISGWRNNDCGCNGQTPAQLLIECEDVLLAVARLGKAVRRFDESGITADAVDGRQQAIFDAALDLGRKFNG